MQLCEAYSELPSNISTLGNLSVYKGCQKKRVKEENKVSEVHATMAITHFRVDQSFRVIYAEKDITPQFKYVKKWCTSRDSRKKAMVMRRLGMVVSMSLT